MNEPSTTVLRPSADPEPEPDDARLLLAAHRVAAARRALQDTMPSDLLHDTALELLMALFIADAEGEQLSSAAAARTSSASPDVSRRWMGVLQAEGLVTQDGDAFALSDAGHTRVADVLRAMVQSQSDLTA